MKHLLPLATILVATNAFAADVYGITTRNQLINFDSASPENVNAWFVTGVNANEQLLSIDFRPTNGRLYALGSFGNIYTINTATAAASVVSSIFNQANSLPITLSGSAFGIDFNPTVDRLRIVSNAGMNLRANVDTGSTFVDGMINPSGSHVVAAGYTNSDVDPTTGTALYTIDSVSDMLNNQNPANSGTQVGVGSLGVDVTALSGMDILKVGTSNVAYVNYQVAGTTGSKFGTVSLATGALTAIGTISMNQSSDVLAVRDIAVTPVPEPATLAALGLGIATIIRRRKS